MRGNIEIIVSTKLIISKEKNLFSYFFIRKFMNYSSKLDLGYPKDLLPLIVQLYEIGLYFLISYSLRKHLLGMLLLLSARNFIHHSFERFHT